MIYNKLKPFYRNNYTLIILAQIGVCSKPQTQPNFIHETQFVPNPLWRENQFRLKFRVSMRWKTQNHFKGFLLQLTKALLFA